ncbi:MAG TPA: hypothetical protein PKE55_07230 [Kiritimatiellia bacterium]|nr:hypothetical protein [Kiritimatiellia bacterium]
MHGFRNLKGWLRGVAAMGVALGMAGCHTSETGVIVRTPAVVVVDEFCCVEPWYPYVVEVVVVDRQGFGVAGAEVELILASVPERRYLGVAGYDGVAVFPVESRPGVVAIAYACAGGFGCDAMDIGLRADRSHYRLLVRL